VAVAAFGQQFRGGKHTGAMDYAAIDRIADDARGDDVFGYRGEFLQMVKLAQSLSTRKPDTGTVD
jgi:Ca-activated chloride channel family protein